MDKTLKNGAVDVMRIGHRIILAKVILVEETMHIVSTYAPQFG